MTWQKLERKKFSNWKTFYVEESLYRRQKIKEWGGGLLKSPAQLSFITEVQTHPPWGRILEVAHALMSSLQKRFPPPNPFQLNKSDHYLSLIEWAKTEGKKRKVRNQACVKLKGGVASVLKTSKCGPFKIVSFHTSGLLFLDKNKGKNLIKDKTHAKNFELWSRKLFTPFNLNRHWWVHMGISVK